jgi:hypothetical protein
MTRLQKVSDNCKFDEYLYGRAPLLGKLSDFFLRRKIYLVIKVTEVSRLSPDMSKDFEQTLTNTGWFTEKNK